MRTDAETLTEPDGDKSMHSNQHQQEDTPIEVFDEDEDEDDFEVVT
jgi:hypothetical protein